MSEKRLLSAILLSMICTILWSQPQESNYHPLIGEGKAWHIQRQYLYRLTEWRWDCNYDYWMKGDTLIEGNVWKKVFAYSKELHAFSYFGAMREEGQKVYFIAKNASRRRLLYDFGLKVGDIVYCGVESEPLGMLCLLEPGDAYDVWMGLLLRASMELKDIDFVIMNGQTFRRLSFSVVFHDQLYPDASIIWIEGVGSDCGLFSPWNNLTNNGWCIITCSEDGSIIYNEDRFPIAGSLPTDIMSRHIESYGINEMYDLQGRRLAQPPVKGIYIKDGRKVIVK